MEYSEAAREARRMKVQYKKYEKLEQMLSAAGAAKEALESQQKNLDALRKDVLEMEYRRDDLQAEISDLDGTLASRVAAAEDKVAAIIESGEQQLKERLVFLQHQVDGVQAEADAEAKELDDLRAAANVEKLSLEGDIASMQDTLEQLRETARKAVGL